MALSGVIQGFLILVVVLMYSASVWKSMDAYFRDEFKKHLAQENERIRKLRQDKNLMMDEKSKFEHEIQDNPVDITKIEETLRGQEEHEGCKREEMPSNKYRNQEEGDECLDSGDVCPFTPPTDMFNEGG
uniref:Selenoprotein S n=1 Tax=Homalodisca liturata TaxID=320908 RepID=A0A1B6IS92_9HEMI